MNDNHIEQHTFSVTPELVEEWIDSFDPSIKTFVANFALNISGRHDLEDAEKVPADVLYFHRLLDRHFTAFLKTKICEARPDRILLGISLPE